MPSELEQELSKTDIVMNVKSLGRINKPLAGDPKNCPYQVNAFKVRLMTNDKRATFDYTMGLGLSEGPKLADVVSCLLSDLQCGQMSFEEFCDNCGYSNDSIAALKTHKACQKNGHKLVKLLGAQLVDQLTKLEH